MAVTNKITVIYVLMIMVMGSCGVSMAAVYRVGDSAGWTTLGNVDYSKWASSKILLVGDSLYFSYNNKFHNVLQVTHEDFQSCNSSPIGSYTSGSDSITLNTTGHFYFICGFPGHCQAGQKVDFKLTRASPSPTDSPITSPHVSSPPSGSPSAVAVPSGPAPSSSSILQISVLWLAVTVVAAHIIVSI